MSTRPKKPSNKPKTVQQKRVDLRRTLRQSIMPAQILSPDQALRTSVKTIAARQLALIEEAMAAGTVEADPQTIARFLKDVTVALKSVQDMERNEASDLSGMSDEEIAAQLEAAEQREAASTRRLMDVLPRGKAEREE